MDVNVWQTIIALIPIIWLIIALGVMKMPGTKACSIGLVLTIILAIIGFKMPIIDSLTAALDGAFMGVFPIVYIIIAAVFTYNVVNHSGSMETIKNMLSSVSNDRRVLVLILAWGFGGFLEAIAGFGTAVAIPAGILAAFGLNPILAAVICLIANTTPTAFGAIGLPVITLGKVGNLTDINHLSYTVSLQSFLLIVIIPFILVALTGGSIKAIKGVLPITLVSGLAFALPQIFVAKYLGAELPAIVGSIVCIVVTILWAKFFMKPTKNETIEKVATEKITFGQGVKAWIPFILVFLFIIACSSLFPMIRDTLAKVSTSFHIYTGANPGVQTINWITSPGTLIIIATYLGGMLQGLSFKEVSKVLWQTAKQMKNTLITVCTIVALSKVMGYSGMISEISISLVAVTGAFYPVIAPIIGALGTFITGSDTSANVLFGKLQVDAATKLNVDPYWIAAANMVGATAGKMISPQSIAIATAATNLIGQEGTILKKVMKYCAVYILIICLVVFFLGKALGHLG